MESSYESDIPEVHDQHRHSSAGNNSKLGEIRKAEQNVDINETGQISFNDAGEDFTPKKKRGRPSKSNKVQSNSSNSKSTSMTSSAATAGKFPPTPMFSAKHDYSPVVVGRSILSSPNKLSPSPPYSVTSDSKAIQDDEADHLSRSKIAEDDTTKNISRMEQNLANSTTVDKVEMVIDMMEDIKDECKVLSVRSLASSSLSDAFPAMGASDCSSDEIKSKEASFPGSNRKATHTLALGLTQDPRLKQLKPLPPKVFKPVGPRFQQPIQGKIASQECNKYVGDDNKPTEDILEGGMIHSPITEVVNKSGASLEGTDGRHFGNSNSTSKSNNPSFSQPSAMDIHVTPTSKFNRTPIKHSSDQNQVRMSTKQGKLTPGGLQGFRPNMPGITCRKLAPQLGGNQHKVGGTPIRTVGFGARMPSTGARPVVPGGNRSLPMIELDNFSQPKQIKRTTTYPPKFGCSKVTKDMTEKVVTSTCWSPPSGLSVTNVTKRNDKESFSPTLLSLPCLAKALSQLGNNDGRIRIAQFNLTEHQIKALDVLGVKEEGYSY